MSEPDEGKEYIARLMAVMEKHIAFLEDALGMKMTPMYKEDDLTRSDMHGMEVVASRLAFPSSAGPAVSSTRTRRPSVAEAAR